MAVAEGSGVGVSEGCRVGVAGVNEITSTGIRTICLLYTSDAADE